MTDEGNFSKKGERKLSSFVGQEMLYDFITNQLDDERKKAVEEFLHNNREVYGDITKINHGIAYIDKISGTIVSEDLLEKIKQPSSYFEVVLLKIRFDQWPSGLRLGLEALVVAVGITCIALILPWNKITNLKFGSSNVVLSEVSKTEHSEINESGGDEVTATQDEAAEFTDEGVVKATPTPAPVKVVSKVVAVAAETAKSKPLPTAAPEASKDATVSEVKRQGFLFRGSMEVTNVSAVASKLVEKINELGGRKAGEVEIGWKRGDGSYFHFTMPESKYDELVALFNEYGQLKIAKEKHERVMPEGIIRLIINVDEKKK